MQNIVLRAEHISKIYGPTVAVDQLDFTLYDGEILALLGANGAGKSTLIKMLSGVVPADGGIITINEQPVGKHYDTSHAQKQGIRVVHQELSLCKNLTVYENFQVEQFQKSWRWKIDSIKLAQDALGSVFPGNTIDVTQGLNYLSIAEQQMVEIARAMADSSAQIIILDEPTSSLPAHETEQLQTYLLGQKKLGRSFIFISHRLKEVVSIADRVFIMQNGKMRHTCLIHETSEDHMVEMMSRSDVKGGQNFDDMLNREGSTLALDSKKTKKDLVIFDKYVAPGLKDLSGTFQGGEIVAVTGLEGNGQVELLKEIFFQSRKKHQARGINICGNVTFVAGDRKKEGVFPLWSIENNTVISNFMERFSGWFHTKKQVTEITEKWNERLQTKCATYQQHIVELSGGNQQKILIARALAADSDIILLDDPTRGVDVETKYELYRVFREAASQGKLIIWRSSEDAELKEATRVVVMKDGTITGEFDQHEFDHSSILKLSFQEDKKESGLRHEKKSKKRPLYLFSLIAMLALLAISVALSPAIASKFGIELLAIGFTPFLLAALAQTYVIGLSHIDLSIGAFMGLVNVVCATILDQNTFLGILALLVLWLLYTLMGGIIYWRKIPPIIVTLGMSFIWTGIAYILQDVPGGHVPDWMVTVFNFSNPILQGVLIWLGFLIAVSILLYRSKYGVILRGFGNNETAMVNSGWSKLCAYLATYAIAGFFAIMGGVAQSAITAASDVNASSTYTMLTVAAVIIGGGYFSGGVVTHAGTLFGGICLTLINIILGLFRVSTDYTATIQGLVLILILSLRLIKKGGHQNEG